MTKEEELNKRFEDLKLKTKESNTDNGIKKTIGKGIDPVAIETAKLNIAEGRRNGFMCWM